MSHALLVAGREWLEADGAGGFASGTVDLAPSRRYHALLLASTSNFERFVLVNAIEATLETAAGRYSLSSFRYLPDVIWPDGASRIEAFEREPWPRWTFRIEDGSRIALEVFVSRRTRATVIRFRKLAGGGVRLLARPLISGRGMHALHHENPAFRFEPDGSAEMLRFRPYDGVPPMSIATNGRYHHDPLWYRNFLYAAERERGLDFSEDLASPGIFEFDLDREPAAMILSSGESSGLFRGAAGLAGTLAGAEVRRRGRFPSRAVRSADDFVVSKGDSTTIIAGYPWFADWGRDTFLSLRGLLLAPGRIDAARKILVSWSDQVSDGMLPNRFPEGQAVPEFNTVDASLWFVVAVGSLFEDAGRAGKQIAGRDRSKLIAACDAILDGHRRGTRFHIAADADGLLAAGEAGVSLTWMDTPFTPRIGKPVEIEALWINALRIGASLSLRSGDLADRAERSFASRFWNAERGCLFDVVDRDHIAGAVDASLRPNQIFAVGGLPFQILTGARARSVVDVVERQLWTPGGLRSLAPDDPAYAGRYLGDTRARDAAYHQGTAWPYLAGPFVEAWCRVRGASASVSAEARDRFVTPLLSRLDPDGIGHFPELADGDAPHEPRGCPFQAWSAGELLRLGRLL